MEKHQLNIELYLSSGGDPKLAVRYKAPTLDNRAKISYLLSQKNISYEKKEDIPVQRLDIDNKPHEIIDAPVPVPVEPEKPKFLGLITQYPVELHSTYHDAFAIWLQLCSFKIKLNAVDPDDEVAAYSFQTKMLKHIEKFDKYKRVLDHYLENKRLLPTISKNDYSNMSVLELDRKKRNLAGLICRRKKTIAKMESLLPEETAPDYNRKLAAINNKLEQLEALVLDQEKILELLV
ncbi:hypothetical protein [Chryseobacterium arthrosphaerae]|nr:hypothetical protein [Chryseobacterium arthrosphaerae]